MKQLILLFSIAVLPVIAFAQTKRIAHKSHSGAEETFRIAYENHLFGIDLDNEGLNEEALYRYNKVPVIPDFSTMTGDSLLFLHSTTIPVYKANLRIDPLFKTPAITDTVRKMFKKQLPASYEVPKKKKGYIVPFTPGSSQPPASGAPWIAVSLVVLVALFSGLFSWQYKQAGSVRI